jgi:hypothetical protein
MIVGTGDLAHALTDREDLTLFASGISNRKDFGVEDIWREEELIQLQKGHLVYFSTLSIFYHHTLYTKHKLNMERLVKSTDNFTIVRIGNITWGDNPNTLINFLRHKIQNNLPFEVQDVYRYLIDKEELNHWVGLIKPYMSTEMNVPGRRLKVSEIVKMIENGEL